MRFLPVLFALAVAPLPLGQAARPNVILVMTDDQGYPELSAHGNPVLNTPFLDKLHSQSVRFTDYHASPMCTPTRGSLMTGLDPARNGAINVSSGRTLLRANLPTMADLLREQGYRTGIFGKWHLGDNYPYRPQDRGFEETLWFPSSHIGSVPDHWGNNYFDDTYRWNGKRKKFTGYCTDIFFDHAIDWIKRSAAAGEPFFAYLPITIPHAAMHVPEEDAAPFRKKFPEHENKIGRYRGPEVRNPAAMFAGMMTRMDRGVGEVLDLLDELKIADNTLVLFTSDNGPHHEGGHMPGYFNSNGPLRGHKRDLYEGGIRVPLIACWPGKVKAGTVSNHISAHWDLMPTLCELAGIRIPKHTDGISYVPTLYGGKQKQHDYLYWEFHAQGKKQAIRMGDWKAVRLNLAKNPDAPIQLYNLAKDIGETKDVAAQHPDVVKRIKPLFTSARVESGLFTLFPKRKLN